MDWNIILTGATAFISFLALWRSFYDKRFDEIKVEIRDIKTDIKEFRKEVKEEFKYVHDEFKRVDGEFKGIRIELNDICQRLTVLETTSILLEINPQPSINARSEAAKKMWERRNKTIERKE